MHARATEVAPRVLSADATDGALSPRKVPVDVVSKSFREVVKVAQEPENAVQPVIGPSFHSSTWRTSITMRYGRLG